MSEFVTDDEIVAVVAHLGLTWPQALPTVALEVGDLIVAGRRGLRSLLVRNMATSENNQLVFASDFAGHITRAITSASCIVVWVAESDTPATLAGNSDYLYLSEDGSQNAILDLVSASGIHELVELSRSEGLDALLVLMRNAFDLGVDQPESLGATPALFATASFAVGSSAVRIQRGEIAFGELSGEHGASFSAATAIAEWDPVRILSALEVN